MVQPVDDSTAKLWMRKPGGAILRKERVGSLLGSLKLIWLSGPSDSLVANARGLENHPLGSTGKLSRPGTGKLLILPPAIAAQRWLANAVSTSGFWPRGIILPLAGATGDWIEIMPCWPNWEEAEMTLAESGSKRLVVMLIFPPGPKTAFAKI